MPQEDEKAVVRTSVRISRFDPDNDNMPEYSEYQAPYEGLTVLQVLEYIYEKYDPTLAFRYGCDGSGPARCGACVVEVYDVPVLACRQQAYENMVVNPHRKFKVIKDLVVDFESEGEKPDG